MNDGFIVSFEDLDMLIHDCRQYLALARGEIESIAEEPDILAMDEPSSDPLIVLDRLRRLKDDCMRVAGERPLDWKGVRER